MTRVLIVDDDPATCRRAADILADAGFTPRTAATGEAALACLRADPLIGAMLLDLVLPERDGMAVLEAMARERLDIPVVMTMAAPTTETVTDIRRAGAMDFVEKPLQRERLLITLHNALDRHRLGQALAAERHRRLGTPRLADFVAETPEMQRAKAVAGRAGRSRLPVLIEGEPGTGRKFLARIIHAGGERTGRPFIAVRDGFAALADACLAAQGGTLFIEEIGELPPLMQLALSQVLETGTLPLPGSARPQRADIRLIATSSRRLLDLTRQGEFREDLFYRLSVLPTYLPPLRQRPEEIEPLVSRFITRFATELGRHVAGIRPEAVQLLKDCRWPLNVRQLEGAVCRAVALAQTGWLEPVDFPDLLVAQIGRDAASEAIGRLDVGSALVQLQLASSRQRQAFGPRQMSDPFVDGDNVASLADVERRLIGFALAHYEGRMSEIARTLGIGRSTLYRKLREYGLDGAPQFDAA
jgi:DNA-binding NtrC family response regulator